MHTGYMVAEKKQTLQRGVCGRVCWLPDERGRFREEKWHSMLFPDAKIPFPQHLPQLRMAFLRVLFQDIM
jgi:hypothetical protein